MKLIDGVFIVVILALFFWVVIKLTAAKMKVDEEYNQWRLARAKRFEGKAVVDLSFGLFLTERDIKMQKEREAKK